jgi:hypothetical protein
LRTCEELLAVKHSQQSFTSRLNEHQQTWANLQQDLQAQRDIPIPVIVVLLEHVRHALQADACLHKQVKAHVVVAAPVVRAVQQAHELRREAVSEGDKGFGKLVVGYTAGVVGVEAVEEATPGG